MTQLANKNQAIQINIRKPILTKSEEAIMKIIQDSLSSKNPITREDMLDSYKKLLHPTGIIKTWTIIERREDARHKWGYGMVPLEDYHIKSKSLQWFKNNLSGCILKGKLIILPVIEID